MKQELFEACFFDRIDKNPPRHVYSFIRGESVSIKTPDSARNILYGSSFVVNLYYVTEITKTDMVLNGNRLVPIPRRSYETVKSKWADYWLDKGDTHAV